MASTFENTFGAKLRNAQDLVNFVQGFVGYAPPRTQETVASMNTLISNIVTSNNSLATLKQQFTTAVSARQNAYRGTSASLEKLLSPIKGAVEAQYGKTSIESKSIGSLISGMRASKLIRLPADPTKATEEQTISQSERSYGSIIQSFNNIVSGLQQFAGYNPSNVNLRIASLQAVATNITTLNNTVAQRLQAIKASQTTRNTQYTDLKDRVQRIKSYVKAQYGMASTEYNMVKGIKV
jgi:hypothetical protein